MHFGLEGYVPLALYLSAMIAFGLSIFWKPQVGLYFLIPLLPLQTVRYRIMEMPLGNKLIDIILLGVVLGTMFKGGFKFAKTPMNKLLVLYGLFCYVQLWRGAFALPNAEMPLAISDPRFSDWKNYMVLFIIFAIVASTIKTVRQIQIVVLLLCISAFLVCKGYYSAMSGRDLTHFSYEVRDGGPLGFAGVNGVATYVAEFMLFLLGLMAYERKKLRKLAMWGLLILAGYCLLFSFSREAYAGILVGALFLGLLKQRWVLVALVAFLMSWQTLVPTSVQERILMTYDKNEQQLDTSAQDRVTIWNDAMNLFQQNPAIGIGFDTYKYLHRVSIYTDTHNYFLKVMVETGVVGLLFFLWVLARMSRIGIGLFRSAKDPFLKSVGLGFTLMMACVFVVNFFGDRWLYVEVNGLLWVALACAVRGQIIVNESEAVAAEPVIEAQPEAMVEQPAYV
ncbi:MAG TPA: O-antigen ligase family protein [Candidatus Angelobacter sp.]|jgi:putative inorganic carbon (HCO3(-)) transporter|nr:O-antigen ligase family protein [Candidatus Angelobacter sp.]